MRTKIIMLLALPFTALAQSTASESFKGANKIEITTGLTSEENYSLAGRILIERGYELDSRDKEFGLLTTKQKGWSNSIHQDAVYFLKIIAQNEKLILTGEISTGKMVYDPQKGYAINQPDFSPSTFKRIANLGKGGVGPYVRAYNEMEEIARVFPNTQLTFIKEDVKK